MHRATHFRRGADDQPATAPTLAKPARSRYHRLGFIPQVTTANKFDPYGGADPRELPAYGISEAAHYLSIPDNTIRSWVCGRSFPAKDGARRSQRVIEPADPRTLLLSFVNLLELHVLGAIRQQHHVQLPKVRSAVKYLATEFKSRHPLIDQDMWTNGTDLFAKRLGNLVNLSREGQLAMQEMLGIYLQRIDRNAQGLAIRLYPFTRLAPTSAEAPRLIVIDPRLAFGRPVISGTRIPTGEVFERFKAGDSPDQLTQEYGRTPEEVFEAIRYEAERAA
jgi:uncharacterized protein (DUF433 family)